MQRLLGVEQPLATRTHQGRCERREAQRRRRGERHAPRPILAEDEAVRGYVLGRERRLACAAGGKHADELARLGIRALLNERIWRPAHHRRHQLGPLDDAERRAERHHIGEAGGVATVVGDAHLDTAVFLHGLGELPHVLLVRTPALEQSAVEADERLVVVERQLMNPLTHARDRQAGLRTVAQHERDRIVLDRGAQDANKLGGGR